MASENLIEAIKILRERTGAGMMDVKKALLENDMDLDKAADYLRTKGIAKAAKKADRVAAEGLANVIICDSCGKAVVYEVNCETDFVARDDNFKKLVEEVGSLLLKNEPKTIEEARELTSVLFTDATVKIGEKLDLRRFQILSKKDGETLGSYIHMGGKIAVALILDKDNKELADNIAMHVAANNPLYISKDSIPLSVRESETTIQIETIKNDPKYVNKPIDMIEKIVAGKVNKVLFESVLSEQTYLLDDTKTVGQVLLENGAKVLAMARFQVGEGIEKKQDDCSCGEMLRIER
ncbi:MAG: translation elongation factor Ts [Erysipelotrichaceae bacterium]|jgi:elongation factor Ts|nr:translation elongation factor Ts [Erysipelotrichaceae bacterium]